MEEVRCTGKGHCREYSWRLESCCGWYNWLI